MENLLHVVILVEEIQHLLHSLKILALDRHSVLRNHLHLSGQETADALLFQRLAHSGQVIGRGVDFERILIHLHVLSARLQRHHHHLVLVAAGLTFHDQHALFVKHEAHGARGAHVAAKLGEAMANIAGGTVAIVGNRFHDHRHAAGRIAFVGDLFVIHIAQLACRLLDGAGNIIIGHIVSLRLGNHITQLAIDFRIAAALAHRNRNFTANFRKNLAAGSVSLALFRLNVMPLGMTGHRIPPTVQHTVMIATSNYIISPSITSSTKREAAEISLSFFFQAIDVRLRTQNFPASPYRKPPPSCGNVQRWKRLA